MIALTSKQKAWFCTVGHEVVAWGQTAGLNWLFAVKVTLAALMAMGIAMRLELDQPRTAMITVVIVMQPQTGMILAKSLYRIGGTLAGSVASLLLVGLFAQERELFILCLAVWVGFCTAGAAFYRNFQSYGFVLAGYTAAMIGLPAVLHPDTFFAIAVTRLTEVTLGILCAGIVNDTIFPRRLSDAVTSNVHQRYTEFLAFVRAALTGAAGPRELEQMHLSLVSKVIALESIRSAGVLEDPEVRARNLKLRKLNSEFMAVSTTFHSFRQLLQRLTKNATPAGRALITLYESLGETLATMGDGDVPQTTRAARQEARRIAAFRVMLSRRIAQFQPTFADSPDPQALMDYETAVELLSRFVRELHAYAKSYAALPEKEQVPKPPDDIRFASRTDPMIALLTGCRAVVAIILVGTFWIASAWPYGGSALTFVTIISALCAATPDPPIAVRRMVIGYLCGFPVAFGFKFLIIPLLDGFMLLCAGLVPVLLVGTYLGASRKWSDIGLGFLIFFISMVAPDNVMQFNPVDFINDGIAMILGVATAGVMFMTLMPATGAWFNRRLARQLRHQVVMACFDPLRGLSHRFNSGTYDLLHKLAASQQVRETQVRHLLAGMFPVIEIGRAIIHVRQDAESIPLPHPLSDRVQESILSTASFFRQPSLLHRSVAIDRVGDAIAAVHLEVDAEADVSRSREVLQRLLTSLHLIRTALLDEDTVLVAVDPVATATFIGRTLHAA